MHLGSRRKHTHGCVVADETHRRSIVYRAKPRSAKCARQDLSCHRLLRSRHRDLDGPRRNRRWAHQNFSAITMVEPTFFLLLGSLVPSTLALSTGGVARPVPGMDLEWPLLRELRRCVSDFELISPGDHSERALPNPHISPKRY